jgi:transposase
LHGANVQQVTRKNASAWKSFFKLSKKKKENELPKWMKPKPPHKKRDELFLLIRNDRYKIEGNERNTNFWSYSSIIKRIKDIAEEYGIKVKLVDEKIHQKSVPCVGKFTKTEG